MSRQKDGSGTSGPWEVLAGSARGFAHDLAGMPNQDNHTNALLEPPARRGVMAAVADGHGSRRHFRSDTGSRLAVEAARVCVLDMAREMGGEAPSIDDVMAAKDRLVPQIFEHWRTAVASDVAGSPFTAQEQSLRLVGDLPEIAYGSTLLVGVWTDDWVLCVQIGDGDILVVSSDEGVLSPVPQDPNIVGNRTTSLCQEDAIASFRFGILDASRSAPLALMLATDGFANSQAESRWRDSVGAEIADRLATGGVRLVDDGLQSWVALCASANGSGDDTTAALVVTSDEGSH